MAWSSNTTSVSSGASITDFLGHHISPSGVHPLASKVNTVANFPHHTSVRQLQEFVRIVNYYHCFIASLAQTMAPLYSALLGKTKSPVETQQEEAFIPSKTSLAFATTLSFPAPVAPLLLSTDARKVAVVLHGLLFFLFSKKLNTAEKNCI